MTKATDADIIKWQLKCLAEVAEKLSESTLKLVISYEEQFKRNNRLSERQMEVLEDIYKQHT